jgi:glucan phosphorylase
MIRERESLEAIAMLALEFGRFLLDEAHLEWDQAWDLTQKALAYTNHTPGTVTTTSSAHEVKPTRTISHLAGKSALKHLLLDLNGLEREYFERLTHL